MFPKAFEDRIFNDLSHGKELLEALSENPAVSVRLHPVKSEPTVFEKSELVPWCKNGFYLNERPNFTLDPFFHSGAYYVQEASSMFLCWVLENIIRDKDIRVLDLCAAPGGKSTLISSWLNGKGLLVSNEVVASRAKILLENVTKWGYANNWVTNTEPYILGGLDNYFDLLVVDAPCSGEGLFRKDRNAINEWSEANCKMCASRQQKILSEILPGLNVGGYLVYSTCTFNSAENDANIQWLLNHFPLELVTLDVSEFSGIEVTENGGLAFYPDKIKGEGFYIAVLKKLDEISINTEVRKKKITWDKLNKQKINLEQWVQNIDEFAWLETPNIAGIPIRLEEDFNLISSYTKIPGGYLTLGEMKGKDLVPHHSLAMSIYQNKSIPSVHLNKDEALNYLALKEIKIHSSETGWHLMKYENQSLGFAKILPNRINNYYPKEWKIRMDF